MWIQFLVFALIAGLSPTIISGAKVKDFGTALLVGLVFGVLNVLIGKLLIVVITMLSLPVIIVTLGLFTLLITSITNMILLKITDAFLEGFELEGWTPAFLMGILIAIANLLLGR